MGGWGYRELSVISGWYRRVFGLVGGWGYRELSVISGWYRRVGLCVYEWGGARSYLLLIISGWYRGDVLFGGWG